MSVDSHLDAYMSSKTLML